MTYSENNKLVQEAVGRIAIVGLGKAGRTIHLPALKKLKNVQIVGAYDVQGGGEALGLPGFASVDQMLAEARPDMVVVATPPASHVELTRRALLADCHVFCEKPLAETLADADAIAALSAERRRQVIVNSEFPFMPIHWQAKRRMAQPGFGDLQFVMIQQSFVVTPETEEGWRGADPQRTLKEFGTHVLDLAQFFYGERPLSLRARMPRPGRPGGPDYLNLLELEFSGDRFAQITLDRLTRGRHRYLDIRLDGTEAAIETSLGGRMQVKAGLRPRTKRPFVELDMAMAGKAKLYRDEASQRIATAPLDLFADATARLLGMSIEAINAGRPPPYTLDDARHTLRLLLACYEAEPGAVIRCGEW
ncbi:Gfo/Idh/MocA family protein [Brevundimonas sp. NPDC003935]|uniref:Gfo/Idh/MocA family protein n=1 Tax=unclassified Brevundimonas TaxID=2622653 RepID=UPI00289D0888|nr:Gfo/Idh/MocA family oxidoreductase [Brevundimonas sp.]